jgi:RNA polymerase sigma-70 factor (ECF subfamily)
MLCTGGDRMEEPRVRVVEGGLTGDELHLEAGTDLEDVYRETAPQLWRAIYGFVGGRRHLAEDAVAEAFARALEHTDRIREPVPWIYRTAFRIASRELQREKRALPPADPDPVPGVDPAEVQEAIRALAVLSHNQRAAVLLHDLEGFTSLEIARLLGISAATVRVHLFRGRRRLRELLGTEEDVDE